VNDGDASDFGLAIYLFQVDAEGVEKPEMVRSHGSATRVTIPESRHAEMIFQFFLHGYVGQPVQKFPVQGHGLLLELKIRYFIAHLGGKIVNHSFDPGGVNMLHLDLAGHSLIKPGRRNITWGPTSRILCWAVSGSSGKFRV